MILGGIYRPTPDPRPILPDLNLVAFERVQRLPQRAVNPLLDLIAANYLTGELLTREKFLLLADEAEAIAS